MIAKQLREKFIRFFKKKNHREIPNVSLLPENDPSALFISAGMHPLVPYLLGEKHPLGQRLVNCQRCLRTGDLEEVGDTFHHTFFEMLGNWSLGDYFKKEMIPWALEFLMLELGFKRENLSVTIFKGNADAPYDRESEEIWRKLGIPQEKIFPLEKKDNWWGPVGETGPCDPDTEIFYDTAKPACSSNCRPGCGCGKYFELWNLVFMEYEKKKNGNYIPLRQKNVDTGMGVERTTAILQRKDDDYQTELFWPLIKKIEEVSGKIYQGNEKSMRIIADHLKAATFIIDDGVEPSNKDRGYVLRRLIRRSVVQMMQLEIIPLKIIPALCQEIINIYKDLYFIDKTSYEIHPIIEAEVNNFLPKIHKAAKLLQVKQLSGKLLFDLLQTYGLPFEVAQDLLEQWGKKIDKKTREEFKNEMKKHQELSRKASKGLFKGGLADYSEEVTRLHSATHLLHQALRDVLGKHIRQVGSNITPERLRFDFTHPEKLTLDQIAKVEALINKKIRENLAVKMKIMTLEQARKEKALAFFRERYGEKVNVYFIGDYSAEVCAGPHVTSTGEIGDVKIIKEESAGAGKRRIYAIVK